MEPEEEPSVAAVREVCEEVRLQDVLVIELLALLIPSHFSFVFFSPYIPIQLIAFFCQSFN